jgi:hypothetical protein
VQKRFIADCRAGIALNKARQAIQGQGSPQPRLLSEKAAERGPALISRRSQPRRYSRSG